MVMAIVMIPLFVWLLVSISTTQRKGECLLTYWKKAKQEFLEYIYIYILLYSIVYNYNWDPISWFMFPAYRSFNIIITTYLYYQHRHHHHHHYHLYPPTIISTIATIFLSLIFQKLDLFFLFILFFSSILVYPFLPAHPPPLHSYIIFFCSFVLIQ